MPLPRLGVVIVTMGNRPKELEALLASVEMQDVPATRVVLIGNATPLTDVTADVTKIPLEENLGCPGGRNVGLEALAAAGDVDVAIELDDDGLLIADDVFRTIQELYSADPELGIVGFRIADENGQTARRWVPRLRPKDPMLRGLVTAFLGGAHAFSMPMLKETGLWPSAFFFGHEESDLGWRALDNGWNIAYEPSLVLQHPLTAASRHATHFRFTARNRVWLARRRLPIPLIPVYLGTWILITMARTRSLANIRAWWSGFFEGWRTSCGPRKPMKWRTVWRMTRLGRPPIL
ncbi:glycosyltransferase family 2 protein [Streptacidiphilus sp. BW17]|uniref:glycosyltransferase family 2 protein n=1 Tax=Streptacidiphilus sp. BW17 TaxID=3156274 RepID=UPI003515BFF0